MTQYHRGRAKSVYRKRSQSLVITFSGVFGRDTTMFAPPPASGSTLIKSVRGLGLATIPTGSSDANDRLNEYASGWVGFARYARPLVASTLDLAESEIFGVKPWSIGPRTDYYFQMDLKGITLTKDETFYLVGECNQITSDTSAVVTVSFLYAEHEMPA